MPQFVILEHDHPFIHWDLMIECDSALRTWRLERPPSLNDKIAATPLADHRIEYLDYEGRVSGGRGQVMRWDRGEFQWIRTGEPVLALALFGTHVRGYAYLCRDLSGDCWFRLTSELDELEAFVSRSAEPPDERPAT